MLKKLLCLAVAVSFLSLFALAGCRTVGKGAGKVVKGAEEAGKGLKKGYKEGRK